MDLVKKYFFQIIILILAAVVFLQRCGGSFTNPKATIDTVVSVKYIELHDTVKSKPLLVKSKPDTLWKDSIQYMPDTNYEGLLKQYMELGNLHFAQNMFFDTVKIDTNGYVVVKDTVSKNLIYGRSFEYSIKYPEKTMTITIKEPYKPRNQVYIGGGISADKTFGFGSVDAGILFKNKKDQIYGIKAGVTSDGTVFYGIQSYWKLSK